MLSPNKVLLIDNHSDNRTLLARTLFRKFPRVTVQECADTAVAIGAAATEKFDVIILHRSNDEDAVGLVRALRKVDAEVPIIVVSGVDRGEVVQAAGATAFLMYDEWLRLGSVVAGLLEAKDSKETYSTPPIRPETRKTANRTPQSRINN